MTHERARDERHLRRAIELAARSVETGGGPFGALVARGDVAIAEGRNRVVAERDPTAHAEIVALRGACAALGTHVLSGCVLYTSCEPCPMCLGAAWWSRVDRIVMAATRDDAAAAGFDDAALYEELMRPHDARILRLDRMLADEALLTLNAWSTDPTRTRY